MLGDDVSTLEKHSSCNFFVYKYVYTERLALCKAILVGYCFAIANASSFV